MEAARGEVLQADLPDPVASSSGGTRPALIVRANAFNRSRLSTVVAVVLTTNVRLAEKPGKVLVPADEAGLPKPSVVNVTQGITADRSYLRSRAGRLGTEMRARVDLMSSRRHSGHGPVALVSAALVCVVAAACSSGATAPRPSAAQALLKSCEDLMLAADPSLTPPIVERRVMPRPPRNAGSSGYACIQGTVSEEGRLTAFKVLRTNNPAFVPACLEALQQWRYEPAVRSGTPVAVDLVVSLSFSRM